MNASQSPRRVLIGALALLGLSGNPERYQKADVQSALQDWDAEAFETAAADAGLVVAAARTFAEWDAHPQAAALTGMPLLDVARIDEADPAPLPSISERNRPLTDVRVLDLTRERLASLGCRTVELDTLWDLDRPEDLLRWRRGSNTNQTA